MSTSIPKSAPSSKAVARSAPKSNPEAADSASLREPLGQAARPVARTSTTGSIRVGIGGWTFAPWRGNFFPNGLPQRLELAYASRNVTAIEINGTYYGTQKPESFKEWHDTAPDDFMFSVKASRYATNRRVLSEAGESIERFVNSGLAELGHKLGPLLWEFARTKQFDPVDFEGFLKLLPGGLGSAKLRHVMDVRHDSFKTPEFIALARKYEVAVVYTDAKDLPSFADITADFVYVRMMEADAAQPSGYPDAALASFAAGAREWSAGRAPADAPLIDANNGAAIKPRDVFVYMINGAKERAPAAAKALLTKLG